MAKDFNAKSVAKVQVLPVLDERIDKSESVSLEDWVLPLQERYLDDRGYTYAVDHSAKHLSAITRDMLEDPTPRFIASLPPNSGRWILLFALDDASAKLTFGSTANAEMTGYLFDKKKDQLVWRDHELGQWGEGGLLGMLYLGADKQASIQEATEKILQTLPVRKK